MDNLIASLKCNALLMMHMDHHSFTKKVALGMALGKGSYSIFFNLDALLEKLRLQIDYPPRFNTG